MRRRPVVIAFAVALAVVAADQAGKWLVERRVADLPYYFFDHVGLRIVYNRGISFNRFTEAAGTFRIVIAVVVVVLAVLLFMLPRRLLLPLALILGGSAANLVDRVRWGHVVDYLTVPFWPTFNIADIAITAGAVLLAVRVLTAE